MSLNHLFHYFSQFASLDASRIAEQIRDIVNGRGRILQTLEIDTRLGVGERGRPTPLPLPVREGSR
jgi:hypothetical protein